MGGVGGGGSREEGVYKNEDMKNMILDKGR